MSQPVSSEESRPTDQPHGRADRTQLAVRHANKVHGVHISQQATEAVRKRPIQHRWCEGFGGRLFFLFFSSSFEYVSTRQMVSMRHQRVFSQMRQLRFTAGLSVRRLFHTVTCLRPVWLKGRQMKFRARQICTAAFFLFISCVHAY